MNFLLSVEIFLNLLFCINNEKASDEIVYYHPISIQKYKNSRPTNEHFNIWMDIRRGIFPNVFDIPGHISIGMPISILVFINNKPNYDYNVSECWSYNARNYQTSTMKMLLTSNVAEIQANKNSVLINKWEKTKLKQNGVTLFYTNTTAFKFKNTNSVYVTCTIQVCSESCNDSSDDLINRPYNKLDLTTSNLRLYFNWHTQSTTTQVPSTTTPIEDCFTEDPVCTQNKSYFKELFKSDALPKLLPDCSPNYDIDPRCAPTSCSQDSSDLCSTVFQTTTEQGSTLFSTVYNPFLPPNCYPQSKDPRCKKIEKYKPVDKKPYKFSKVPNCYPGSKDNRCKLFL